MPAAVQHIRSALGALARLVARRAFRCRRSGATFPRHADRPSQRHGNQAVPRHARRPLPAPKSAMITSMATPPRADSKPASLSCSASPRRFFPNRHDGESSRRHRPLGSRNGDSPRQRLARREPGGSGHRRVRRRPGAIHSTRLVARSTHSTCAALHERRRVIRLAHRSCWWRTRTTAPVARSRPSTSCARSPRSHATSDSRYTSTARACGTSRPRHVFRSPNTRHAPRP